MRRSYIKIFSFVLCLLILTALATLCVGAKETDYVPVEWKMDENATYLYGNDKRYERYYANGNFYGDAITFFVFMNSVEFHGKYHQVRGESADPHIVSVYTGDGYSYIFVDKEGKKILDDFLSGKACIYYFEDRGDNYTVIDEELVYKLEDAYNTDSGSFSQMDVRDLSKMNILNVTAHDKTETKAYQQGAVYITTNGEMYYVSFKGLDNSYFDSDGYFSYRQGTVKARKLPAEFRSQIYEERLNLSPKPQFDIYESDVYYGYTDIYGNPINNGLLDGYLFKEESANIVVFVVTVFGGILVPTPLLILSAIFAKAKKTGKAKCWYALTASAAVWLAAGITFLILLIV